MDAVEAERHKDRQQQGIRSADRVQGDQTAGCERPDGDRDAQRGRAAAQPLLDLGSWVRRQGRVDEPRLQRPRIQGPIDALEDHGRKEYHDRVGDGEDGHRDDGDDRCHEEHGPAAQRVGQAARRELEGENDEALRSEDEPDLL